MRRSTSASGERSTIGCDLKSRIVELVAGNSHTSHGSSFVAGVRVTPKRLKSLVRAGMDDTGLIRSLDVNSSQPGSLRRNRCVTVLCDVSKMAFQARL
jgi:hypothetical protein